MVVYDTLEDIPYNILAQGGTFEVRNVPSDMNRVGYGMGAMGVEALTPGTPGELPDPNVHWIVTILIAHSGMIIGMIAVAVVCTFITPLIFTIMAVPQGEIVHEFEDGSLLYQSGDGSSWILHDDGRSEPLGGVPPSIEGVLTAIAVVVIVGVIAYLVITFTRKPAAKKVEKKAAPEPG